MGTISSEVLVQVMDCVQRSSSEDLLKLLDRLMTEGQSPSHFAKQLVRFLRNALVAKVAGGDSPLLQISSDERQKIASTAALFSEEDLTRFLNIVLRTHDELGYRQEQRFHLELGMLKMVHASRLLPLEEFLSQAAASGTPAVTQSARASLSAVPKIPETRSAPVSGGLRSASASPFGSPRGGSSPQSQQRVSPFEADRLRKVRTSEPEMSVVGSVDGSTTGYQVISTATALEEVPQPIPASIATQEISVETLRSSLISVLETESQDTAADLLARGEWKLDGSQINLGLPLSEKVIDLSISADARRLLTQEASRLCGRMMKLNLSGGGTSQNAPLQPVTNGNGNRSGGARQRAAEDPVVRRMQEKFGAEVRTVVDLRQKK